MNTKQAILTGALAAFAFVGAVEAGKTMLAQDEAKADTLFDYEKCDIVTPNLSTSPLPVDDWKELTRTPGGNWCVTLDTTKRSR